MKTVIKIDENAGYDGCGHAYAAIKNGVVVKLVYQRAIREASDKWVRIDTPDRRYKTGFRSKEKNLCTKEDYLAIKTQKLKELESFGAVKSGECSCWEFLF